ncbi:hypothetical protein MKEN_00622900 [Mycena kentingensis (nom. inval.)]|nr:hypothetical protein MKEN_00622900 [Mycena kentingensis (nom. inval.)]
MTTFERLPGDATTPGGIDERLRLWRIQKGPEVHNTYTQMKQEQDAKRWQRVCAIMARALPAAADEHRLARAQQLHDIKKVIRGAEKEDRALEDTLHEGVEAQAAHLKSMYAIAGLEHPGEQDPTAHVREQIAKPEGQPTYCSPVLHTALFLENNVDPAAVEADLPARTEALLDFHCVAFHADVGVMMQLLGQRQEAGTRTSRAEAQEVLKQHRDSMERLSVEYTDRVMTEWLGLEGEDWASLTSPSPVTTNRSPSAKAPPAAQNATASPSASNRTRTPAPLPPPAPGPNPPMSFFRDHLASEADIPRFSPAPASPPSPTPSDEGIRVYPSPRTHTHGPDPGIRVYPPTPASSLADHGIRVYNSAGAQAAASASASSGSGSGSASDSARGSGGGGGASASRRGYSNSNSNSNHNSNYDYNHARARAAPAVRERERATWSGSGAGARVFNTYTQAQAGGRFASGVHAAA